MLSATTIIPIAATIAIANIARVFLVIITSICVDSSISFLAYTVIIADHIINHQMLKGQDIFKFNITN
jgi:hypothetical protein